MPASLTRNEFYWITDRLIQEMNHRASVYSRWCLRRPRKDLVATIEDRGKSKKIEHGPVATSSRIAHALLRDERLHADPDTPDIGIEVPQELIQRGTAVVQSAIGEITRQFSRLAKEERVTGALQYDLNRFGTIEHDGWQLTFILQGFTEKPKEKRTGADLGVIVDLKHAGRQVSKGFWAQAKQADTVPDNPLTLPDLKGQIANMLKRTPEAYGVIYTPNGIEVFQGWESRKRSTLSQVIGDVTACRRGDRRPQFLADTVHRDYLIEMEFESTGAARPTKINIDWAREGF